MPQLVILDSTKTGRQAEELENQLHQFFAGQEEAIYRIVRAYQTHVAGLSPVGRPIGNFLFLGPNIWPGTSSRVRVASSRPGGCVTLMP